MGSDYIYNQNILTYTVQSLSIFSTHIYTFNISGFSFQIVSLDLNNVNVLIMDPKFKSTKEQKQKKNNRNVVSLSQPGPLVS